MRWLSIIVIALPMIGCAAKKAPKPPTPTAHLVVNKDCVDKVEFTKACPQIDDHTLDCNHVHVLFHCVKVKKD
jgi:hypothetical protein